MTWTVQLVQPVKIEEIFTKEQLNMSTQGDGLTRSTLVISSIIGNLSLREKWISETSTRRFMISGIFEFVQGVVEDEKNHFGLKTADKSVKKEILTELMKGNMAIDIFTRGEPSRSSRG